MGHKKPLDNSPDDDNIPIGNLSLKTNWDKMKEDIIMSSNTPEVTNKEKKTRYTLKKALMPLFEQYSNMTGTFNEEKFRNKHRELLSIMGEEGFNKIVADAKSKVKSYSEEEINSVVFQIGFSAVQWLKEQNSDEE